jgi:hypothetical protein
MTVLPGTKATMSDARAGGAVINIDALINALRT